MSRTLDAGTLTAVGEDITTPYYLVFMDFATPVRYSTRHTTTYDTNSYLAAGINITWSQRGPTLSIFNENTTFGQTVLGDGTAGRQVIIWQTYFTDPGNTTPIEMFNGVMGEATIGERVVIRCLERPPNKTPRHYAVPPTFNHMPKSGTKIETKNEVIILESR